VEVELIDDHVRFGTYHRLDFGYNLERQLLDPLDHKIKGRFYSADVSFNTHPYGKALQTIIVSCQR